MYFKSVEHDFSRLSVSLPFSLGGKALDFTAPFEIANDLQKLVLEIQMEGSKSMKDAERATLRALLQEMEESEIMDCTVCGHEVARRSPMESVLACMVHI